MTTLTEIAHDVDAIPGSTSDARPLERRRLPRFDNRQTVMLDCASGKRLCELTDISRYGARIVIGDDVGLCRGNPASLVLFDGTCLPSLLSWSEGRMAGLEFNKALDEVEATFIAETLGGDFYRRALQLQKRLVR